ncbi:MAG: glycosyltransferase family 4 protein [Acidobacteria bacterium]|nr:glycosyltransferase family 4 protein [Acidobacteriota bacterium]
MKLAVVVQRYGADIAGGAELHARYVAERLSSRAEVTVFTTCARDYVTWRNDLPEGSETINGVRVERFHVARERDVREFDRWSRRVFTQAHSVQDELAWLDSEGPTTPALVARLKRTAHRFDYVLLFSVRYYHAYHGAGAVGNRAVLVPTAERDPSLGLGILGPLFRGVRAIMYNSFEERALINAVADNDGVSGVVVGVGSNVPTAVEPDRARQTYGLSNPFIIYVGRIDANKGCAELFDFFIRYSETSTRPLDLALIGTPVLEIPRHPRIRHLGYVGDRDKFDLMAAAEALVMPSYYESLSMVALEAWALGRPVLANARCDVLLGQCRRSNAGLYYEDAAEFAGALDVLLADAELARALGRNGRDYVARHYSWPIIERKYFEMFDRLSSEPASHRMEPLPGWLARRKRTLPPAAAVVASAPSGPALGSRVTRGGRPEGRPDRREVLA